MKAKDIKFKDLLKRSIQLRIPIYQRAYDWEEDHCRQLYDDIKKAGESDAFHFIGAITSSAKAAQPVDVPRYQVIDGQQRITTIILLIRALKDAGGMADDIGAQINDLLFNTKERNGDPNYYKLVMNEDDNDVFQKIMESGRTNASGNLAVIYDCFLKWLAVDHAGDIIWKGLQKLTAVSIFLEERDDSQAIFESMNSTGLDLSETDLIKNYLLMKNDPPWQERMYREYWHPLERRFDESPVKSDEFFRCYLSMKEGRAIEKTAIYKTFKKYMSNRDREKELVEIVKHYNQYTKIIGPERDSDRELNDAIGYACDQETDVANPLLLKILADHAAGGISDCDAKKIFTVVGSYLLRGRVCGTLAGANKRFPKAVTEIKTDRYVESVVEALLSIKGRGRFPRDEAFIEDLQHFKLYTNTVCRYILFGLNGSHKEMAKPDKLTIEHIMPQNLNDDWKAVIGEKHAEIYERHLHTIGNLTLTAYNSELSNMPFQEKCTKYRESLIPMTRDLAEHGSWGEKEIRERARNLAERAAQIWQYPKGYDMLGNEKDAGQVHDLMLEEDYLGESNTAELWNALKGSIRGACSDIVFQMNKHYASFKLPNRNGSAGSVVCSIESLRSRIHVTYNAKIHDGIIQPSNFVGDISKKGHFAPGDFRTTIASMDDVERVVTLVKTVYDAKVRSRLGQKVGK